MQLKMAECFLSCVFQMRQSTVSNERIGQSSAGARACASADQADPIGSEFSRRAESAEGARSPAGKSGERAGNVARDAAPAKNPGQDRQRGVGEARALSAFIEKSRRRVWRRSKRAAMADAEAGWVGRSHTARIREIGNWRA